MKPPLRHTAYKVTTTRNVFGDYVAGVQTALPCHFRYITDLVTGSGNETIESDAMAWFNPDSGIEKGDILVIYSRGYMVENVIEAPRLRSTAIQFIKVTLSKYGIIS